MMKLVTFELCKEGVLSQSKNCLNTLPFIEEALYSMCETVICLVTVPNVEESRELG